MLPYTRFPTRCLAPSFETSFETRKAMIKVMLVEASQNHSQAETNVSATGHVILTVY